MNDEQEASAPDLSALLQQAQVLQDQLIEARDAAAAQVVRGSASNGAVSVEVTGGLDFRSVHIDPTATDDVELLEDLTLAALRDAMQRVNELNEAAMGAVTGEAAD